MTRRSLPKYVHRDKSRHGKVRYRFIRRGFPQHRFEHAPGTPEFIQEYQACLNGELVSKPPIGADRVKPGTLSDLIVRYRQSSDWIALKPGTRRYKEGHFRELRDRGLGDAYVADFRPRHIQQLMDEKADTPSGAMNIRKTLRVLFDLAILLEWRKDNPVTVVKRPTIRSDGIHTWSEAEIDQFCSRWPIGTKERLAMELMLGTGQRSSDIRVMTRNQVRDGLASFNIQKTGKALKVAITSRLQHVIDQTPPDHAAFITSTHGAVYANGAFYAWFKKACVAAGLPHCSPHGLRKAACVEMVHSGCTTDEMLAVTGHSNPMQLSTYTRKAQQELLAKEAATKRNVSYPGFGLETNSLKSLKKRKD